MAVKAYKSKRDGKQYYRFDWEDHTGSRYRRGKFRKASDCETALTLLKTRIHNRRYGLIPEQEETAEPARVTLSDLVAARIRQRKAAGFTRRNEANNLKRFAAILPAFLRVADIAPAHILKFQEDRSKKVKPQTVWRELTDIFSMFLGASDLYPALKRWTPPARPRLKVPSGERTRVISRDEAAQIIAYLRRARDTSRPEDFQDAGYNARLDAADALQIALQTAARNTEIRLLRWSDFNPNFATLTRRQWKTGAKPLVVPISPALVHHLAARRARQLAAGVKSDWIFPSSRDPARARSHFETRHWRRACEACGIPYGRFTEGGLTFHDSRHTLVTTMLDSGATHADVQSISGHSSKVMLMRYAHATTAGRRRAVEIVADFGEQVSVETPPVEQAKAAGEN